MSSYQALMKTLEPETLKQMGRDADAENEAENGLFAEEPGDCFVCAEDRPPSPRVSLGDDIPDYFAGTPNPNPIRQSDED